MSALYWMFGAVTVALLVYLLIVLVKPDWFGG